MFKNVNIYSFFNECYVTIDEYRKLYLENIILKEDSEFWKKKYDEIFIEIVKLKKEKD